MAKALFGYVGGSEARLEAEVRRLRSQVEQLQQELTASRAALESFATSLTVEDDLRALTLEHTEPALT